MADQTNAGRQIGDRLRQVAGQKLEDAAKRQAVSVDRLDSSRIGIKVVQFGQGLARAAHLRRPDGDEGPGLAVRGGVETPGVKRPTAQCHHLLSRPQQGVGASQAVGGQGRQRLSLGVPSGLVQGSLNRISASAS